MFSKMLHTRWRPPLDSNQSADQLGLHYNPMTVQITLSRLLGIYVADPGDGIAMYGLQALIGERLSTAWNIRRCFKHWKIKEFHCSTFSYYPHYMKTKKKVFLAVDLVLGVVVRDDDGGVRELGFSQARVVGSVHHALPGPFFTRGDGATFHVPVQMPGLL